MEKHRSDACLRRKNALVRCVTRAFPAARPTARNRVSKCYTFWQVECPCTSDIHKELRLQPRSPCEYLIVAPERRDCALGTKVEGPGKDRTDDMQPPRKREAFLCAKTAQVGPKTTAHDDMG